MLWMQIFIEISTLDLTKKRYEDSRKSTALEFIDTRFARKNMNEINIMSL